MSETIEGSGEPKVPLGKAIARNVFFLTFGQVISTALGFLLTVALGRSLGPSDFGVYYSVLTLTTLLGLIVDWGQTTFVLREVARNRPNLPAILGTTIILRLAQTLPAAIIGYFVARLFGYHDDVAILAPAAVIIGGPGVVAALFGSFLRARNHTEYDVASGLIGRAVAVSATILGLWLGGGVGAAVLLPALGGLASLLFSWRMARRFGLEISRPTAPLSREIILFGGPIILVQFMINVQSLVDITLLTVITSPTVVGWYGAARIVLGILIAPATILGSATFPELCRASTSSEAMGDVLTKSARPLLALGALGAAGVFAFSHFAVAHVYGAGRLDQSADVLQFTAPFFPLFFMNFLLGNAVVASGRNTEVAFFKLINVIFGACLGWLSITYFQKVSGNGAIGLVVAFGISELIMAACFVYLLPKGVIAWTALAGMLVRSYLAAAGGALGSLAWLHGFPTDIATTASTASLFAISFVASGFATGLLQRSDMAQMSRLFRLVAAKASHFGSLSLFTRS